MLNFRGVTSPPSPPPGTAQANIIISSSGKFSSFFSLFFSEVKHTECGNLTFLLFFMIRFAPWCQKETFSLGTLNTVTLKISKHLLEKIVKIQNSSAIFTMTFQSPLQIEVEQGCIQNLAEHMSFSAKIADGFYSLTKKTTPRQMFDWFLNAQLESTPSSPPKKKKRILKNHLGKKTLKIELRIVQKYFATSFRVNLPNNFLWRFPSLFGGSPFSTGSSLFPLLLST